jgi:hypothetical protein
MNIIQEPLYKLIPVYQPIIFVVEDDTITATKFNVKFIAKVRVAKINTATTTQVVTLKVSPNGQGKGIFDLSKVLQSYVTSDNLGGKVSDQVPNNFSTFKSQNFEDKRHSIHNIDKFATNKNSVRLLQIEFGIQYSETQTGSPAVDDSVVKQTEEFVIYNGTLQEDDMLQEVRDNFGYNLDVFNYIANDTDAKFLTDCPTTLEIGANDYHTVAFFNNYEEDFKIGGVGQAAKIQDIVLTFFPELDANGTQLSATVIDNLPTNGGSGTTYNNSDSKMIFFGCGTANIKNTSTLNASTKSYTLRARDANADSVTQTYVFNLTENDCKGFEKIRLTWLNRHGAWDYFNFTKKNVRTVNTTRKSFQQLKGTWNEDRFRLYGYKGGTKTFRTNSKEIISLNTDFITEETAIWFEQLFTSPEVYILSEFSADTEAGIRRKYVKPVVITSQTYTRQTKANDKLIQYSLEIEMSKDKVIQHA